MLGNYLGQSRLFRQWPISPSFRSFVAWIFFSLLATLSPNFILAEPAISPLTFTHTVEISDLGDAPGGAVRKGTLRDALANARPGTRIVFTRPGTIRLTRPLEITNPGIFIDGTENPVVLYGDVVRVRASNVYLRHLWIFAGDSLPDPKRPGITGHSRGSDRDALVIWGPSPNGAKSISNIVIEHCWIGFGIDECLSTYGAVKQVSVRDSIIGFGLNRSLHPDDKKRLDVRGHGKGVLVGVGTEDVIFSQNILIDNFDRNIQVRSGARNVRFINNIVYGWGRGNTFVAGDGAPAQSVNGELLGNIYLAGRSSSSDSKIFKGGDPQTSAAFALRGNVGPIGLGTSLLSVRTSRIQDAELLASDFSSGVLNAWQAFDTVLAQAGPHPGLGDRLSLMGVEQIIKRSGDILDFTAKPVNSEAKKGLGYLPTLKRIVDREKLRPYRFTESAQRVLPSID